MLRRFKPTRESFIPKGAPKVVDKQSDGIAYIYSDPRGRLLAMAFHGKAAKPDWHYSFKSEEAREKWIRDYFAGRQARAAANAEYKAKRNAPHKLEVGHILNTCWGYDQTNREFFQITRIVGPHTVELREIAQVRDYADQDRGTASPRLDDFIGEPIVRRARADGTVRIDDVRLASIWSARPVYWSSYA